MLSADSAKDGTISFSRGDQIFGKMLVMSPSEEERTHAYPLLTRAWCLQERFMAPRILHFGVDELHWECSGEAFFRMTNEKMWQKRLFTDGCTVGDKASYWFNISNQYSERTLTKWTDRLSALSGPTK